MNADEARAEFVTVLHAEIDCDDQPWGGEPLCTHLADALMPTVRALIAEELRALAQGADEDFPYQGVDNWLNERADAIEDDQ